MASTRGCGYVLVTRSRERERERERERSTANAQQIGVMEFGLKLFRPTAASACTVQTADVVGLVAESAAHSHINSQLIIAV